MEEFLIFLENLWSWDYKKLAVEWTWKLSNPLLCFNIEQTDTRELNDFQMLDFSLALFSISVTLFLCFFSFLHTDPYMSVLCSLFLQILGSTFFLVRHCWDKQRWIRNSTIDLNTMYLAYIYIYMRTCSIGLFAMLYYLSSRNSIGRKKEIRQEWQ